MYQQNPKNRKDGSSDRVEAILSLNRALWGEVSPALRAATIQSKNNEIYLIFYYDGEVSEEDQESAECVGTGVIADFPEHTLQMEVLKWDAPKPIPQEGELVYLRREQSRKFISTPQINEFKNEHLRTRIILSTIFALINEISSALREVRVRSDNNQINLDFYYDGKISEEDRQSVNNVASKVIHDFSSHKIKSTSFSHDYPKEIPMLNRENGSRYVYVRKEPDPM